MALRTAPRVMLLAVPSCMLMGCSLAGAPSYELFGAFFPAWMFCALIGIFAAAGVGVILRTALLNRVIPWPLAVCTSVGVIAALLVWRIVFR
jgi:YtcA family